MMTESLLKLSIGGFPPFSARGCTQTLKVAPLGELRRCLNGRLHYIGGDADYKYISQVQGKDKMPPAFEALSRGTTVSVECLSPLTQKIKGDGKKVCYNLKRPAVPQSALAYSVERLELPIAREAKQQIQLKIPLAQHAEAYITYRPNLIMKVQDFSYDVDEWENQCRWYLDLEEV